MEIDENFIDCKCPCCGEAVSFPEHSARGLEIAPVLREVAAMSSDENKYGMGSTSQMLLRHS